MRIGGGIGSNEGDTPIYIANIHPHGCIGKSKQLKVSMEGDKKVNNKVKRRRKQQENKQQQKLSKQGSKQQRRHPHLYSQHSTLWLHQEVEAIEVRFMPLKIISLGSSNRSYRGHLTIINEKGGNCIYTIC